MLKKTNGMVCQAKTSTLKCCPSYCCSVESTMHDVQQDSMDMGFRNTQTAVSFQISVSTHTRSDRPNEPARTKHDPTDPAIRIHTHPTAPEYEREF